jgi:hypothetical protein
MVHGYRTTTSYNGDGNLKMTRLARSQEIVRVERVELHVAHRIARWTSYLMHQRVLAADIVDVDDAIVTAADQHVAINRWPIHTVDRSLMLLNQFR